MDRRDHIPALDGLRALAVAAVLLFHGGVRQLPGGFLGVDVFFVLSGFLITTLLLRESLETGRLSLAAFWDRRARRLLPALVLVLITVTVAGRFLLPPDEVRLLRWDSLAALGYVANWRMLNRGDDYFARTSTPSPLQHTWSLGIEEQFYLLWPLIVAGLLWWSTRRARSRAPEAESTLRPGDPWSGNRWQGTGLLAVAVWAACASAIAAAALYRPDAVDRAYFGTDTRGQALLIGCAAAVLAHRAHHGRFRFAATPADQPQVPGVTSSAARYSAVRYSAVRYSAVRYSAVTFSEVRSHRARKSSLLGAAAIAATIYTGWLLTHATGTSGWLYRGGLTGLAVAVALILVHTVRNPDSRSTRLLSLAPLTALGKISYGVYLWHWPLFQFLTADRTGLTGPALLCLRCALTLTIATCSYHLIEQPIRRGVRWSPLAKRTPLAPFGVPARLTTAMVALMATGALLVAATAGPTSRDEVTVSSQPSAVPGNGSASASGQATSVEPTLPDRSRPVGVPPRVTFFGDSVAWTLGSYLPRQPRLTVTVRAIQGCGITTLQDILQLGTPHRLYPNCPAWQERWQAGIDADDPDIAVILLNRWEFMDARLDGTYQHVGQPDFDAYLTDQLDRAIAITSARGAKVALLTAAYTHRAEAPNGGLYPEDQPQRVDAWNALVRSAGTRHSDHVTVIDLGARACPTGSFTWNAGGVRLRSDGLHFTPAGVRTWLGPWLVPQLEAMVTN